jgi:hypothetical protein
MLSRSNHGIFADIDHTLAFEGVVDDNHIMAIPNADSLMVMTRTGHKLIIELIEDHWFIPTTARSFEEYNQSVFAGMCKVSITDNGGQVNINGKPCDIYKALLQDKIDSLPTGFELENVGEIVAKLFTGFSFTHSFDYGMYWAFRFDPQSFCRESIENLIKGFLPEDYTYGFYKTTFYVNPVAITKVEAVKFVRDYLGIRYVFAMGDSDTDTKMLKYAHCGLVSPYGDIVRHNLLDQDHNLIVAPEKGTKTVDWMLNHVAIQIAHNQRNS